MSEMRRVEFTFANKYAIKSYEDKFCGMFWF